MFAREEIQSKLSVVFTFAYPLHENIMLTKHEKLENNMNLFYVPILVKFIVLYLILLAYEAYYIKIILGGHSLI